METQPAKNYRRVAITIAVAAFIVSAAAVSYYSSFGRSAMTTTSSPTSYKPGSPQNQTTLPQTSNVVVCTQTTYGEVDEVSISSSDGQTYTIVVSSYTDVLATWTTTLTTNVNATIGYTTTGFGGSYPTCTYVEP